MEKLRALAGFAFENFGPILVFYGINHFYGLKAAIVASTLCSVAEIAHKIRRKEKLTSLFKFSALMTLVFGAVDLYSQQSFLFRYEPCVTNIFTGTFFGASLFSNKTVIQEFREKSGDAKPMTRDRVAYFKLVTLVWTAYFFAKASAYCWMASNMSLEQGMILRTVLGTASFYALLFVSIVGSRRIFPWMKRMNLLPAAEGEAQNA